MLPRGSTPPEQLIGYQQVVGLKSRCGTGFRSSRIPGSPVVRASWTGQDAPGTTTGLG